MIENNPIHSLPYEIQKLIYKYSLEHPLAKIIRELINETDEINNLHLNIETLKYEKLSFYNILCELRYLKGYYYFDDLIDLLQF